VLPVVQVRQLLMLPPYNPTLLELLLSMLVLAAIVIGVWAAVVTGPRPLLCAGLAVAGQSTVCQLGRMR